jgi:hydrogenase nickel incorporation protein HypA/HybF
MHEFAITESLLNQVLAEAQKQHATQVNTIKLRVGEGRSIVPDCVQFYFETLSKGTLAERARLEFELVPLKVVCRKCRVEVRDLQLPCSCQAGVDIVAGQELDIEYLEIEQGTAVKPPTSASRPKAGAARGGGKRRPR